MGVEVEVIERLFESFPHGATGGGEHVLGAGASFLVRDLHGLGVGVGVGVKC